MASATVFTPRTASWLEDAVKRNTMTDVCVCTDTDRWSVNSFTDKPSSCAAGARIVSSAWRTDAYVMASACAFGAFPGLEPVAPAGTASTA